MVLERRWVMRVMEYRRHSSLSEASALASGSMKGSNWETRFTAEAMNGGQTDLRLCGTWG